jgi:hypothetical protein
MEKVDTQAPITHGLQKCFLFENILKDHLGVVLHFFLIFSNIYSICGRNWFPLNVATKMFVAIVDTRDINIFENSSDSLVDGLNHPLDSVIIPDFPLNLRSFQNDKISFVVFLSI